jgi:site-specific recombinase XerD
MHTQRGLAFETIRSYRSRVLAFLNWLQPRCAEFSSVRPIDIEEFFEGKRSDGWALSSVAALCHALRTFFGYAERQGWCSSGLQMGICSPRVPRIAQYLNVPEWEEVRRVIASIGSLKPSDLRAKAMFLLFFDLWFPLG